MDGTLTPPRESLDESLVPVLEDLSEVAEIGIVTGSDFEYLKQQVGLLIEHPRIRKKLHLLPCNGTKHYYPPKNNNDHQLVSHNDMARELGRFHFQNLMMILIEQQMNFANERFPLTGHFINYRGSMINWCPIGRNANSEERQFFVDYDNSFEPTLRERYLDRVRHYINIKRILNVEIKLGGDTSFDIFPSGWDKTYALKHFPFYNHWFVGDRCGPNGNDKELYDFLKHQNRSYETNSPQETGEITKAIIDEIKVLH
jgi:phosphomannomutase